MENASSSSAAHRFAFASALVAAAFAAGCASAPEPEPDPEPAPYVPAVNVLQSVDSFATATHEGWKMVEIDGVFAQALVVSGVESGRTRDGFKRIQVRVKNLATTPVRAAWRFEWTGGDGMRAVDPYHDSWETKTFQPGDEGAFSAIAPRKDCEDWKLLFRAVQ